jgi:leader peptidase (prepilin peptidase)/N-methyltransferase
MNDDILLQEQVTKNLKPVILISGIIIIWSFIVIDPFKELIRAIILIVFMNVIATINYYDDIIPDKLNLLFGIVGIIINLITGNVGILSMIGGLLIGGGGLFIIAFVYEIITKREGLGGGLIKYVAVLGLWLGYKYILVAIVLGFIGLAIILPILVALKFKKVSSAIPADMFFSFGTLMAILYGDKILNMIGW